MILIWNEVSTFVCILPANLCEPLRLCGYRPLTAETQRCAEVRREIIFAACDRE